MISEPVWKKAAECRGMDPAMFIPTKGEPYKPALRVCARCRVVDECLEWAIATGEMSGIWGNTRPIERRAIIADRNRTP
jgi:WhiB family redox-sensing transcriptional regulator